MTCVAALLLILQSAAPFQQPQQTQDTKASIEGFVVRAGTNEAIPRARITAARTAGPGGAPIQPSGPRQNIAPVTTDGLGHFVIKDLDAGSYLLTAQRNGFARQTYGERAPGRPGVPLNIVAGQTLKDLIFRLIPGGTISGRVIDPTGEPLAGITIQLVRGAYDQNGKRTFQPVNSARTNDRGEYRIYWITPGRYYVNASPSSSFPFLGFPNGNEVIEPGYVLTYYPGINDASAATPIEIQPGAELSAIDFTLTQQRLFRVHGRLFDGRTGQFPRNANVSINPRPTAAFSVTSASMNYNPANGTFELRDVPSGSYWLRALALPDPGAGFNPGDARNNVQVALDVSNADVENVVLTLTPGFQIKGRIDLDGESLSTLPDIERVRVALAPIEPGPFGSNQPQIKSDGTFTLENVQPGDYRLNVFPMPANTFIQSTQLGQTDVTSTMTISGPISDSLEILLSRKGGLIDGTIVDKDRKALPGIQAILIPDRQRVRRDLYKFGTSDQNGQFTMRTVAPGDYKLFAWEDLEPGAYNDPDFLQKYEELATRVKVSELSKTIVELKVIPMSQ